MTKGGEEGRTKVSVREHFLGDKSTVLRGIRLWADLLLRYAQPPPTQNGKSKERPR